MKPVKEIFGCISGNSGLTEEKVYSTIQSEGDRYKVLSGATDDIHSFGEIPLYKKENGRLITVFNNKPGILVTRKGKAGKMNFLPSSKYTINDDAYILYLLDSFKADFNINKEEEVLFLKYFIFVHQHNFYDYSSSSDNSTWSKTAFFKNCEFFLPPKKMILSVSLKYETIINHNKKLTEIIEEIEKLLEKEVAVLDSKVGNQEIKLNEILTYTSRNDSLSEEGIYNNCPTDTENIIKVLSGSNTIYYGKISSRLEKVHVLKNTPCLHVVSRGSAGTLTFIPKGTYATNTNAFLLYLKRDVLTSLGINNYSEEIIYLQFLRLYLQPIFRHASSQSDVSVFPLTKLMASMEIPSFQYNEKMKKVVRSYNVLEKRYTQLKELVKYIEGNLEKKILL